jgi:hypothetical protein
MRRHLQAPDALYSGTEAPDIHCIVRGMVKRPGVRALGTENAVPFWESNSDSTCRRVRCLVCRTTVAVARQKALHILSVYL